MDSKKNLTIFQRGLLQNAFTAGVYLLCLILAAFSIDWFEKKRFIAAARQALEQERLSQESFVGFQRLIESATTVDVFMAVFIAAAWILIGYACIKFSTRFNLVQSTTLPKAVEFSSAMRKLGILELDEQMDFVRKQRLSVFIAATGILDEAQENVAAKLYPFSRNPIASKEVFALNIGKRTLCLDAEEYERILHEGQKRFSLEESVALAQKDEELKGLKTTLAALTSEHTAQAKELGELRGKAQIQPAQEKDRVSRLRVERLQWAVLIHVAEKLMREAPKGKQYTTPEIEAAYAAEWERRDDLKAAMLRLTGSEDTKPSEYLVKAIKEEFREVGLLSLGGRPKQNP